METLKTIAMRKSTRSYKAEQVTQEELNTVLHAGCAAPVGSGKYETVHMTVIQKPELLDRITQAAAKASGNPDAKPFYGAPTVILISCKKREDSNVYIANAACIVENMHLAATDLGLGSVYLWGFLNAFSAEPELLDELSLPKGFVPVSAMTLGYPTEPLTEEKELSQTININTIK